MKIANKISVGFFVVAATLTGIALIVFYNIARNDLKNAISNHLSTTAESRARHIESYLETQEGSAVQLSNSVTIANFLRSHLAPSGDRYAKDVREWEKLLVIQRLEKIEKSNKDIYGVLIVDANGKIAASSDKSQIGADKTTDEYFLKAKEKPHIKGPYISKVTGKEILAFSAPIIDSPQKKLLGVVVIRTSTAMLNKITTDRCGLGKTGEIYLLNKDGCMITQSRFLKGTFLKVQVNNRNTRSYFKHIEKLGSLAHEDRPFIYRSYMGNKVLGVHAHVPYVQWCLIAEIDLKEAFQPLVFIKSIFVVILGTVFGVAWVVGIFMSNVLVKPIKRLEKGVAAIGRGDLDYKIGTDEADEVGELSRAFDKMTTDLKKSMTSIGKLNMEVSERKKAEEALKKAYGKLKETQDQLVQAEKLSAVGQLASGVAHEVRNPLGIIIQGINYLEKTIAPKKEDINEAIVMIKNSVRRADKIINLLLDFSRAVKLELLPEDLKTILGSSLTLAKTSFKAENIEIVWEMEKSIPKVLADKRKLEQVFINIFLNSIQAMPKGGKIVIRCYKDKLKQLKKGIGKRDEDFFQIGEEAVIVEVEDTGSGISEEAIKKIFEPFFTTKDPGEGVGLGLYVTQNIITTHKGLLEMKSEPGKGTRIIVTLKVA